MRAHAFIGLILIGMASCAVGVAPTPVLPGDTAPPESDDPSLGSTSIVADSGMGHDSNAAAKEDDADVPSGPTDAGAKASAKDAGTQNAPDTGSPACPGYALPNETADCVACDAGASNCQANGCYGGYYCNISVAFHKCSPKPSGC